MLGQAGKMLLEEEEGGGADDRAVERCRAAENTMKISSPERCQVMLAGLTNSAWLARRNPASPAIMPLMT